MLRMMIAACLCLVAMPLAGCATTPISYPKARTALERAADAYARIRGSADGVVDRLPEPAAGRARLALAITDAAMLAARRSGTAAEQEQRLRELAGDVAELLLTVATDR